MSDHSKKRQSGFSLLEMVISMALGTIVLGSAVQIYIQGVSATWTVTHRAEMQQDFRAASVMMTKDLSLAGAGLGSGAAIPLAKPTTPQFGCDQTAHCYLNGIAGTYPLQSGSPYMYGLIPGYNLGPILNAVQGATDTVTTIYTDSTFYLNCYSAKITAKGVVTFYQPTSPATWTTLGCLPNTVTAPQAVNDASLGLTAGDLVLLTLGGTTMVAEVTGVVTTGVDPSGNTTYIVPFANSDALKMNQTPAGGGLNTAALLAAGSSSPAPCGNTGPCRLLAVTYYIDNTIAPPRLMRQVSGHSPVPVAKNVAYLKYSYDLFNDSTGTQAVNQADGGVSLGLLPNQITKINILNMAINSSQMGSQFGQGNGYQRLDLQTSVGARNLSYVNDYPN
jgi:prepilin-type N-terminal cleavage/methylation domain-containing protein